MAKMIVHVQSNSVQKMLEINKLFLGDLAQGRAIFYGAVLQCRSKYQSTDGSGITNQSSRRSHSTLVFYITLSPIILHNAQHRVPTMKSCIMYIFMDNVYHLV